MRAVARGEREIVAWWGSAPEDVFLRISDLSGRSGGHALDGVGWRREELPAGATSAVVGGLTGGRLYWVELAGSDGARLDAAGPVETPRRSTAPFSPLPDPADLYGRS